MEYCLRKVGIKALIAQEVDKNENYYKLLTEIIPELTTSEPGNICCSNLKDLKSIILITENDNIP